MLNVLTSDNCNSGIRLSSRLSVGSWLTLVNHYLFLFVINKNQFLLTHLKLFFLSKLRRMYPLLKSPKEKHFKPYRITCCLRQTSESVPGTVGSPCSGQFLRFFPGWPAPGHQLFRQKRHHMGPGERPSFTSPPFLVLHSVV